MRNAPFSVALVLFLTLGALWGILAWDPFAHLRALFVGANQAQEQALVRRLYVDPGTQETSNGQSPLSSFRMLEPQWCSLAKEQRYILTGNSQTLTVLLAPSESSPTTEERTYPDLLLERVQSAGMNLAGFRLSAPNISYMEVLWYLHYLLAHPCLTPGELIVQLNFETFRKTSIRDGMLELLSDQAFQAAAAREARSEAAYSGVFQQAIIRYNLRLSKEKGSDTEGAATTQTGLAETRGSGGVIETRFRATLETIPVFRSRANQKAEFLDMLYLARVHMLGITPTTKRSLGGGALMSNEASLMRIGELCKEAGIRLVFFNAPQNPDAPLYRTAADRQQYLGILTRLSRELASTWFDFESSIPGSMWGVWIDGPDPIHFGRAAHRRLANLMFESGVISRPN